MQYELVVVVDPVQDAKETQDKLTALLEKEGFVVSGSQSWGKKPLSYRIKKQREGLYFLYNITSKTNKPKQLEARFKLEDMILRTIILKKEEKKAKKN